jgi:multidrug transporter EmrE-like cation transporter
MAWLYLASAIATEVVATVAFRYVNGFTRPLPSAVVVIGYALSFYFFSLSLRGLSLGVTYAVWAGAGTAAIAVIGVIALGEPISTLKLASIALIIGGVIGLNAAGGH